MSVTMPVNISRPLESLEAIHADLLAAHGLQSRRLSQGGKREPVEGVDPIRPERRRRPEQCDLVHQAGADEGSSENGSGLDHEPSDPAAGEKLQHGWKVELAVAGRNPQDLRSTGLQRLLAV